MVIGCHRPRLRPSDDDFPCGHMGLLWASWIWHDMAIAATCAHAGSKRLGSIPEEDETDCKKGTQCIPFELHCGGSF